MARSEPLSPSESDFEDWYRQAWPRVVRAVEAFSGERIHSTDIAADAMAQALGRWNSPDRPHEPTAWTVAVALNLARRRHSRWRRERDTAERLVGRADDASDQGSDPDLRRAIAALPVRMRTAVVLRYVVDMPDREVARQMGISEGTVAAMLHRARAQLRHALQEKDHD